MESKNLKFIGIETRIKATRGCGVEVWWGGKCRLVGQRVKVALRGTNINVLINTVNIVDNNIYKYTNE